MAETYRPLLWAAGGWRCLGGDAVLGDSAILDISIREAVIGMFKPGPSRATCVMGIEFMEQQKTQSRLL
jgi:hypothetical protein